MTIFVGIGKLDDFEYVVGIDSCAGLDTYEPLFTSLAWIATFYCTTIQVEGGICVGCEERTVVGPIKTGHEWVLYSPDIATGGYKEIKIWDAVMGKQLARLKHDRQVSSSAWTSDVISASYGQIRTMFDTATWQATVSCHCLAAIVLVERVCGISMSTSPSAHLSSRMLA